MAFEMAELAAPRWECWECTVLSHDDPARGDCICKVHRPTPVIAMLLEPLPPDLHVQASMLSGKLRLAREQVRATREDAKFEERYDPFEAEKLRDDVLRWQMRSDRIEADLRRVQTELNAGSEAAKPAVAPAKKHPRTKTAARAPRTRSAKPKKAAAKRGAASKTGPLGSTDVPGSGEPAPAPSDSDPEVLARPAGRQTVAEPKAPLLERTRDFWQKRTGKSLTLEDAREIIENSVGYIRLLNTWAKKRIAEKSAGPTSVPEETDTSADAEGASDSSPDELS